MVRADGRCPLPDRGLNALKTRLYDTYQVEIPLAMWNGQLLIRASFQRYNTWQHVDRVVSALADALWESQHD